MSFCRKCEQRPLKMRNCPENASVFFGVESHLARRKAIETRRRLQRRQRYPSRILHAARRLKPRKPSKLLNTIAGRILHAARRLKRQSLSNCSQLIGHILHAARRLKLRTMIDDKHIIVVASCTPQGVFRDGKTVGVDAHIDPALPQRERYHNGRMMASAPTVGAYAARRLKHIFMLHYKYALLVASCTPQGD